MWGKDRGRPCDCRTLAGRTSIPPMTKSALVAARCHLLSKITTLAPFPRTVVPFPLDPTSPDKSIELHAEFKRSCLGILKLHVEGPEVG